MKKLMAIILCITMMIAMIAFSGIAMAEDAASELNLEDLMVLLEALSESSDEEADTEIVEEYAEYSVGDLCFSLPASWDVTEDDTLEGQNEAYMFVPDLFTYIAFACGTDESFDVAELTMEDIEEMFIEMYTSDDSSEMEVVNSAEVTICGQDAIWIDLQEKLDDTESALELHLISFTEGENLYAISITEMLDCYLAYFAEMLETATFKGENLESDISAAVDVESLEKPAGLASYSELLSALGYEEIEEENVETVSIDYEEGAILAETDECKVYVESITPDDTWGYTVLLKFENKTEDTTITFVSEGYVYVNGYKCSSLWGPVVEPGETEEEEICFYESDLEICGIENVYEIEFDLHAMEADVWTGDYYFENIIKLYPEGQDAEKPEDMELGDDANVVIDEDYAKVVFLSEGEKDEYYGDYSVYVYVENLSDKQLQFTCETTRVNGEEFWPYWSDYVDSGKKSIYQITWYESDLDEAGITSVDSLEIDAKICDGEDWFADPILEKTVIVK